MGDCKRIAGCPFFNDKMGGKQAMAELYKKKYCQGDSTCCARHMVFEKLGKPGVPKDLFPNMVDKAQQILADAGVSAEVR